MASIPDTCDLFVVRQRCQWFFCHFTSTAFRPHLSSFTCSRKVKALSLRGNIWSKLSLTRWSKIIFNSFYVLLTDFGQSTDDNLCILFVKKTKKRKQRRKIRDIVVFQPVFIHNLLLMSQNIPFQCTCNFKEERPGLWGFHYYYLLWRIDDLYVLMYNFFISLSNTYFSSG